MDEVAAAGIEEELGSGRCVVPNARQRRYAAARATMSTRKAMISRMMRGDVFIGSFYLCAAMRAPAAVDRGAGSMLLFMRRMRRAFRSHKALRDRLMVGHEPLKLAILVRIQVPQHAILL